MSNATAATFIEPTTVDATLTRVAGAFLAGYRSEATRRLYRTTLHRWFAWCRAWQLDPMAVKRTHIELWTRHLEDRGLAPSTRGTYLAVVRSFYGWCVDEELAAANPAARVKPPHEELSPQPAYSRTEMARLLEAAAGRGGYDHATILLLYGNGLRVSEACGADVADLGTERYHRTLRVVGKGDRPVTVPLPPATALALDKALAGRQPGPLLISRAGTRMVRATVVRTIRRCARDAGVPPLSPHALRRTIIQLMLADGKTLREVQLLARHADPKTTAGYDNRVRSMDEHLAYDALRLVA